MCGIHIEFLLGWDPYKVPTMEVQVLTTVKNFLAMIDRHFDKRINKCVPANLFHSRLRTFTLHYFLGFEIGRLNGFLTLSQCKFTTELIRYSGILESPNLLQHPATPLPLHLKLNPDDGVLLPAPGYYRSLVGKLNFLINTRPDLAFSVQTLSQYMQAPREPHLKALHHLLSYVHYTACKGLLLEGSTKLNLQAFSALDWAAYTTTRKLVTGYVVKLGNIPISWKSKKQSTISRSSAKAEYRAMAQASSEVTWLVRLLEDLGVSNLAPVTLHCDNTSTIHIVKNPVFYERTKHIKIDCHLTRAKVMEGLITLAHVPTVDQIADILTKVLPAPQHHFLLSKLGLVDC
ncbi:transmembrane signal receptor [Lithospermum erythrorhizon]|uniref:Transmembrane signal receptor n=1 Tax=Lithospermum erythrorhizon TaxID=34254 RepID=A0AAV3Q770_LITER